MEFIGEPGRLVRVNNPRPGEPAALRFDSNGRCEVSHPVTIRRMKQRGYQEATDAVPEPTAVPDDGPKYHCKQCGYMTDNKGDLLAHYRKEHPKEG